MSVGASAQNERSTTAKSGNKKEIETNPLYLNPGSTENNAKERDTLPSDVPQQTLGTSSSANGRSSETTIHVDPATGRRYSYNTQTNTTDWLPEDIEVKIEEECEVLEDGAGRRYSWNPRTDETKWLDSDGTR